MASEGGYGVRDVRVLAYSGGRSGSSSSAGRLGNSSPTAPRAPPPGVAVAAAAFISRPWARLKVAGGLPPRQSYKDTLVAGASARGLDPAYVAWLASLPTAPATPGWGLPGEYFETPGRDAVVVGGLGLAAGMVGVALAGGVLRRS